MAATKHYELFTDGSCLGNPGTGGYAAFRPEGKVLACGNAINTTNNRMELRAVIEGLKVVPDKASCTVVSDSKYVTDAFNKGWIEGWEERNWKTSARKPVANDDLWKELSSEVKRLKKKVKFKWVKGHAGHPGNELCDKIAQEMAKRISDKK